MTPLDLATGPIVRGLHYAMAGETIAPVFARVNRCDYSGGASQRPVPATPVGGEMFR